MEKLSNSTNALLDNNMTISNAINAEIAMEYSPFNYYRLSATLKKEKKYQTNLIYASPFAVFGIEKDDLNIDESMAKHLVENEPLTYFALKNKYNVQNELNKAKEKNKKGYFSNKQMEWCEEMGKRMEWIVSDRYKSIELQKKQKQELFNDLEKMRREIVNKAIDKNRVFSPKEKEYLKQYETEREI